VRLTAVVRGSSGLTEEARVLRACGARSLLAKQSVWRGRVLLHEPALCGWNLDRMGCGRVPV